MKTFLEFLGGVVIGLLICGGLEFFFFPHKYVKKDSSMVSYKQYDSLRQASLRELEAKQTELDNCRGGALYSIPRKTDEYTIEKTDTDKWRIIILKP